MLMDRPWHSKYLVFGKRKRRHFGPASFIDIGISIPTIQINQRLRRNGDDITGGLLPRHRKIIDAAEIPAMDRAGVTGIPLHFKSDGIALPWSQRQFFLPPPSPWASIVIRWAPDWSARPDIMH